jgi:hypothetical protein
MVAESVTSDRPPAMTPVERKRRQRQREQAASEPMRFISEEWRDFTSPNGLERKVERRGMNCQLWCCARSAMSAQGYSNKAIV